MFFDLIKKEKQGERSQTLMQHHKTNTETTLIEVNKNRTKFETSYMFSLVPLLRDYLILPQKHYPTPQ